jgi:CheY-like chemotaxis protein
MLNKEGTKMSNKKHILCVDDDLNFLNATMNILEGFNYKVTKAQSPQVCFETLEKELPDLIILDVMMAQVDSGFDICRKLKTEDRTKGIPILMLTAIDKKYPFHLGKSGSDSDWMPYDDFLDKPVQANELLKHVQKLLKGEDKEN